MFSFPDIFQAGSSPVSSISGFSVGSGRVDEAVDDFKVGFGLELYRDCQTAVFKNVTFGKTRACLDKYACTVFASILSILSFRIQIPSRVKKIYLVPQKQVTSS